jgi:hypothetical protein
VYFAGLPEAVIPVRDEVGPTMVNEHTTALRHPLLRQLKEWKASASQSVAACTFLEE